MKKKETTKEICDRCAKALVLFGQRMEEILKSFEEPKKIPNFSAGGIVFDPPFPCQPTITYKAYKMGMKCSKIKTCSNGPYYCYTCKHNPILIYGSDWIPEDYYKQINQNTMNNEIIIDEELHGLVREFIDYINSLSPKPEKPKELTLEDCIENNKFVINAVGQIRNGYYDYCESYGMYPNYAIAEKVLLYGLLQSVARKLNEGKDVVSGYSITNYGDQFNFVSALKNSGTVLFATSELAEQAIKIFENSKFDLKKLFQ